MLSLIKNDVENDLYLKWNAKIIRQSLIQRYGLSTLLFLSLNASLKRKRKIFVFNKFLEKKCMQEKKTTMRCCHDLMFQSTQMKVITQVHGIQLGKKFSMSFAFYFVFDVLM